MVKDKLWISDPVKTKAQLNNTALSINDINPKTSLGEFQSLKQSVVLDNAIALEELTNANKKKPDHTLEKITDLVKSSVLYTIKNNSKL